MSIRYSGAFPLIKRSGDIGYDLYSVEDEFVIKDHQIAKINTGIRIEFPKGYYADVRPKSGMSSRGLFTQLGLVDNSYRGEISVNLINVTGGDITIKYGDKVGQLVIRKENEVFMEQVDARLIDTNTNRGENGFGSTGVSWNTQAGIFDVGVGIDKGEPGFPSNLSFQPTLNLDIMGQYAQGYYDEEEK